MEDHTLHTESGSRPSRSRRPQERINARYLRDTLDALQLTPKDMADQCGVSPATIRQYLNNDSMPRYIRLACEGLRRRFRQEDHDVMALIQVPDRHFSAVALFVNNIGGSVTIVKKENGK